MAQLKGVWRARLRGSGIAPQYSGFAQPIVYDGVAYVSTGANDVFALSIDTGEALWQYAANLDANITSVCCGWNNKGVAISEDNVFEGSALVNDGRIFTPFVGKNATIVAPGIWGGASWSPSAYDPVQQRMFVCASSVVNGYTGGGDPKFVAPVNGNSFLGGAMTFTRIARTGIIAALDVTTNTLAWRYQWPEQCYSGTLATAGGLLFVGRNDGRLTALDSATGTQVWEFQTGAGMHAPVSTFEHKGKQYVLAFSAGSALLGSARGDSVWLFGLDGGLPPAEPGRTVPRQAAVPAPLAESTPAVAAAATSAAPRVANADVVAGQRLYEQACVFCHGTDGKGDHGGAPLAGVTDFAVAIQTVTAGRNNMPPFRTTLTPGQIRDVSGYVIEAFAGGRAER